MQETRLCRTHEKADHEITRRLSGVLGTVGMCLELVNLEWTV